MENLNTLQKLQQLQILVSFWRNQTFFAISGETKEEKLGIGFAKRYETISTVDPEQKEWLDYLEDGEGPAANKMEFIWDQIHRRYVKILNAMPGAEISKYRDIIRIIGSEIQEAKIWMPTKKVF